MNTKLTLNLNKGVIEEAKNYAKEHRVSLSKLIESYLKSITQNEMNKKNKVSPLVKSLTGVIPTESADNFNNDYYEHLTKKYS